MRTASLVRTRNAIRILDADNFRTHRGGGLARAANTLTHGLGYLWDIEIEK